jgi:hypothetical protein
LEDQNVWGVQNSRERLRANFLGIEFVLLGANESFPFDEGFKAIAKIVTAGDVEADCVERLFVL